MKSLSAPLISFRRTFFLRTEMDRLLSSSMFFSCTLVLLRILHTGSHVFIFMIWNLFLAYIPYALSTWMLARYGAPGRAASGRAATGLAASGGTAAAGKNRTVTENGATLPTMAGGQNIAAAFARTPQFLLALIWLLFVPNAFYILTDLYHLNDGSRHTRVPEWFDLVLILSFAWNGLLLGVLSVRHMEKLFLPRGSLMGGWLFVYPIMVLNALGVYAGRYLRFNSWDILSNPLTLLKDITGMIIHPIQNQTVWSMVLCFSILLTLIYRMLRGVSKALS